MPDSQIRISHRPVRAVDLMKGATMAQKIKVMLIDDVDGSNAEETISFSLDGVSYEIDLSKSNAKKLRDSLSTYIGSARRVGGRAARGTARGRGRGARAAANNRERVADIRAWAKSRGLKVSDRGRIPASIIEQYEASH
jgi:hypothetical protein